MDEFLGPEVVDGNEDEPWQVDVFPHNWLTVMVYKLCRFDRIATMSHVVPVGVSSSEALSVFEVLGVEQCDRPDLLAGIRVMSNAACEYIMNSIKH